MAYLPGLLWQVWFDLCLNFVRLCPFSGQTKTFFGQSANCLGRSGCLRSLGGMRRAASSGPRSDIGAEPSGAYLAERLDRLRQDSKPACGMSAAVNINSPLHFPRRTRIKGPEAALKSFDIRGRYERLGGAKPLWTLAFGDSWFSLKQILPVKRFFPPDWVVSGCSKW